MHAHTQAYWSVPGSRAIFKAGVGLLVSWQHIMAFGPRIIGLQHAYKREWSMAAENNARGWYFPLSNHVCYLFVFQ